MKSKVRIEDISKHADEILSPIEAEDLVPLPLPYDKIEEEPDWKEITPEQKERLVCNLDGVIALNLPQPKDKIEEKKVVDQFVSGLKKLLSRENNWTFLQPLLLSIEYCVGCQTCNDACPIFTGSGRNEIYRPTYRSEVFRRLVNKYVNRGGKLLSKFSSGDIDLNWTTISRLYELSHRCTLCRRCAQSCPMGVDNGLITHELRKLFSQELGWAATEVHEKGSVLQLKVGSSTGMNPLAVKDNMEFIDEDISEETGITIETPWDVEGADILLIHNAGEILSWPEIPAAFALILNTAGISWTLASEEPSYDGVNYGLWYDDFQLSRVAMKHIETAKRLKVKKIVVGECGHAHKALITIADRILTGENNIPRESCLPLLEKIVFSGKIEFDPQRTIFRSPCMIPVICQEI